MDERLRQTVRERAGHRCEYCSLAQDAEPFFAYNFLLDIWDSVIFRLVSGPRNNKYFVAIKMAGFGNHGRKNERQGALGAVCRGMDCLGAFAGS
jgi:hypothetical protein